MTLLDLDTHLRPITADSPCGEALDYDLDFLELETASRGMPARHVGSEVTDGTPPDWTEVGRQALALSARTKDLRIAILLARAAVNTGGFDGLRQGIELVAGYAEQYWPTLHPRPDAEDGEDETVRLNALANLCDPDEFLADVRRVRVTRSGRFGAFSWRDHLDAQRQLADDATAARPHDIEAAFSDTDPSLLERVSQLLEACDGGIARIDQAVRRHLDGEAAGLGPLADTLRQIRQWNDDHRPSAEAAEAPATAAAAPLTGEIRDRGDIVGMLDRICRWYRLNEPASPVAPLLERATRLVSKDFMALLLELAPAGAAQFRALAGLPDGPPG